MNSLKAICCAIALGVAAGAATSAAAQSVEDFYKGKRVTVYIGSSAGGGTDLYGRTFGQFLGNVIPGKPSVVISNMPGANGMALANQLYKLLPKDGTAIGTFDRNAAMHSVWGNPKAQFVAAELNWIGSANIDASTCVTWHTTGIDTLEKFITQPVVLGSTAIYHANALNTLFGAKLKQVTGYPGGNDVLLALERGEVEGRCNWSWSSIISTRSEWVRDKKINVIVQFADEKHPDLPNVPLISDLAKTDRDRQMLDLMLSSQVMARPFAAPPGVPADRVKALRDAFMAVVKDPAFIAASKAQQLEVDPVSGERIQQIVQRMTDTPKPLLRELRDLALGPEASAALDKQ
ncbi:MAG: Bug family tripartite tricarboxylate transporter substrate binding protein [Alphaproteobacteria bacterium]